MSHFGGYAAAAGLTIQKQHFNLFKQVFEQFIASMDTSLFNEILWTDGELPLSAFQIETVDELQNLTPWGQKFPSPIFEGIFKIVDYRWLKEIHLKLRLALENGQIVEAIAFNAHEKFEFNSMQDHVRLIYELGKNEFNGKVSVQLRVIYLEQ